MQSPECWRPQLFTSAQPVELTKTAEKVVTQPRHGRLDLCLPGYVSRHMLKFVKVFNFRDAIAVQLVIRMKPTRQLNTDLDASGCVLQCARNERKCLGARVKGQRQGKLSYPALCGIGSEGANHGR